jgi:hypothetical protein
MHEDQIYAMEDYITQYQQLVCKYRSENAALRKQLENEYYDQGELPEPRQTPRTDGAREGPPAGTPSETREAPGQDGQQPRSRDIEIELPDVPPLEGSTFYDFNSTNVVTAALYEPADLDYGEAASAAGKSHRTPSGLARAQAIIDPSQSSESQEPKHQLTDPESKSPLRLHGEVVANDLGAGPRLVVNVESADDFPDDASLDGEVSLMLLANHADGEQKLARWDFGRADVQAAKDAAGKPAAMQFFLELPADTSILKSTELWVRLVKSDASKLLAHADVDLSRPGTFASAEHSAAEVANALPPASETVENNGTSIPARIAASFVEGEWSIARPGEPANLPSPEDTLTGGWRTSSEPIAMIGQSIAVAAAAPPVVQQASHVEGVGEKKSARTYKPPTWSPDRPGKVDAQAYNGAARTSALSKRPAWSATR